MGEVVLAHDDFERALAILHGLLEALGAEAGDARSGHAGSVGANWQAWRFHDGETVEIWSDNYEPLSLRGSDLRLRSLCDAFERAMRDG